jgi:hypothetical protein
VGAKRIRQSKMKTIPLLSLLVLCACKSERQPNTDNAMLHGSSSNLAQRLLVQEAVLSDLGISPKVTVTNGSPTIFLLVAREEKADIGSVYASTPTVKVRVRDSQEAAEATTVNGAVIDSGSSNRAVICNVSVTRLNGPNAEAVGGLFYGDLGGTSYSYELRLQGGRWSVTKKKPGVVF